LGRSESISDVAKLFTSAGFKAPISRDIRTEIMLKIFGNMSFNPISALTHATLEDICLDVDARTLITSMMQEGMSICNVLNLQIPVSIEKRIAGAQAIGQHKTSMLQDIESGRSIELDSLVAAMIELGEATQVSTPYLRVIYTLTRLLDKTLMKSSSRLRLIPR
jgi:2-dehydropantoate 2-reductase